jgi:hypothetical protein
MEMGMEMKRFITKNRTGNLLRSFSFSILAVFLCAVQAVHAEVPTDTPGKIRWIQERLDQASGPARRWQYGWSTAYAGMSFLYSAQASSLDESDEDHDRYDAVVNASSSFLGFAGMMIDPLKTYEAADSLMRMPGTTDEDIRIKLEKAEALLREAAERERRGKSWQNHLLAGIVNLAAGVAVALDDHRNGDGAAMFAAGMLVSEIQIYSQPTHTLKALEEYCGGGKLPVAGKPAPSRLSFYAAPRGVVVQCRF